MPNDPSENRHLEDLVNRAKQKQAEFFEKCPVAKEKTYPAKETKKESKFKNASYPRDLTRISPFYPVSQKQLQLEKEKRPYFVDKVLADNSWGTLVYTGYMLSVFDEDVLLAVLALIDAGEGDGNTKKYEYIGYLYPILYVMGYAKENIGKSAYERVKNTFEYLAKANLAIKTRDGSWEVASILTYAGWKEDDKKLKVVFNPYFYERYIEKKITLLDVIERSKIKTPTGKAIYRFVVSHKTKEWKGNFLLLAKAVNVSTERPKYKIRETIKNGIKDLCKVNILAPESGFENQDTVFLKKM